MALAEGHRFRISHTWFSLLFCGLVYWVSNALNMAKLAQWFPQKGGYDLVALAAYLLAGKCLFLVFFVLLAHRWTIKPLAILLLAASAAAAYFISKYDVAIDSSMILNTIHTDSTEVGQLLSVRMIPYVLLLIAVPVMAILPLEITFASAGRYLLDSTKLVVGALVIAVLALYSNYNAIHRAGNVSNKYIVYSLVPVNVISGHAGSRGKAGEVSLRTQEGGRDRRPRHAAG